MKRDFTMMVTADFVVKGFSVVFSVAVWQWGRTWAKAIGRAARRWWSDWQRFPVDPAQWGSI